MSFVTFAGLKSPTARDLMTLIGLAFLLIAAGMGLRDPWPADEPRFALAAPAWLPPPLAPPPAGVPAPASSLPRP